MTLYLTFSTREAEPYEIGGWESMTIADAIQEESWTLASDADADHIEDPSDDAREAFRRRCVGDATAARRAAGDTWRDPFGVLWRLVECA
jgi:hypothetical protein